MARALAEYRIVGVRTTLPILERIVSHPDFRAGRLSTGFLDRVMPDLIPSEGRFTSIAVIAAVLARYEGRGRGVLAPSPPSPWRRGASGWTGGRQPSTDRPR
ncbi:MAG: 3-methylcrotonyl-CoA carboxylase, partial [Candidatus Rokuibacteriota bacterium]